jgi:leucyl/phenylalanyl-tRNA--protein transferase
MIPWLEANTPFPDVSEALTTDAPGLLAAGADLSPQRLLQAYRNGIFPWFSEGQPILWWSTDPRMVLYTDRFKVSDSLKKTLRKVERAPRRRPWVVRFDSAFESVMRACAAPRKDGPGTWISEDIIAGYTGLHRWATPTRPKCGWTANWSAAPTASASAACFMANRCSRACRTPPRWRWPTWSLSCAAMACACSTASRRPGTWPRWAPPDPAQGIPAHLRQAITRTGIERWEVAPPLTT